MLKILSGGSPATVTISNSRSLLNMEDNDDEEEEEEKEEILGYDNDNDDAQYDDDIEKTTKMELSQKPLLTMEKNYCKIH